jgi:hypothetical protein
MNAGRTAKSEGGVDLTHGTRERRDNALTCGSADGCAFRHHGADGGASVLTIEDIAGRAGVDVAYVRRLVDLGALGPEDDG